MFLLAPKWVTCLWRQHLLRLPFAAVRRSSKIIPWDIAVMADNACAHCQSDFTLSVFHVSPRTGYKSSCIHSRDIKDRSAIVAFKPNEALYQHIIAVFSCCCSLSAIKYDLLSRKWRYPCHTSRRHLQCWSPGLQWENCEWACCNRIRIHRGASTGGRTVRTCKWHQGRSERWWSWLWRYEWGRAVIKLSKRQTRQWQNSGLNCMALTRLMNLQWRERLDFNIEALMIIQSKLCNGVAAQYDWFVLVLFPRQLVMISQHSFTQMQSCDSAL